MKNLKARIYGLVERNTDKSNIAVSIVQKRLLKLIIGLIIGMMSGLLMFVGSKEQKRGVNQEQKEEVAKVELPDSSIDTEKRWREHFERLIAEHKAGIEEQMKEMEEAQNQLMNEVNISMEKELADTKEKLRMAREELASAGLELKKIAGEEEARLQAMPINQEAEISRQEFGNEHEFDQPKSAANYIPEGTYFTGHLLGGIVVSTGLNAADEHATPVAIRLIDRGNLNNLNKLEISKCRIMGSSYGDLASERAIIRLEKMICERDGVYITSKISGQVYGEDGYNGIKGEVVSTSSKHLKNAIVGGMISGLSSSGKGQEGFALAGGGIIPAKNKGMKEMLGQGALQGTSNAGEKIAQYYLKQAESMSPVLTIPAGVRVNAQITKGFL